MSHEVSGFWFCDCLPSFVKLHQTPFSTDFQNDVDEVIVLEVGVQFHQEGIGYCFVQSETKQSGIISKDVLYKLT